MDQWIPCRTYICGGPRFESPIYVSAEQLFLVADLTCIDSVVALSQKQ